MSFPFPNPQHPELLTPPIARAAYSNRAAWVMAHMSRMAYYKFEGDPDLVDALAEKLAAQGKSKRASIKRELDAFLDRYTQTPAPGRQALEKELGAAGFRLVETFDKGGTQAYLALTEKHGNLAVLAFRGTEKNHGDIKTDLNLRFYRSGGVGVHNGFQQAFRQVEAEVKTAYAQLSDYKVYITGHSLGGALAKIATRALDLDPGINTDNLASCYTFGSPKVGTLEFGDVIKTPIYRVVNDADAVSRLPPSYFLDLLALIVRIGPVPFLRNWLDNYNGYRHVGDMRYLTTTRLENYADVRLVSNPDFIDKLLWLARSLSSNLMAGYERHAIGEYCDKLEAYALKS